MSGRRWPEFSSEFPSKHQLHSSERASLNMARISLCRCGKVFSLRQTQRKNPIDPLDLILRIWLGMRRCLARFDWAQFCLAQFFFFFLFFFFYFFFFFFFLYFFIYFFFFFFFFIILFFFFFFLFFFILFFFFFIFFFSLFFIFFFYIIFFSFFFFFYFFYFMFYLFLFNFFFFSFFLYFFSFFYWYFFIFFLLFLFFFFMQLYLFLFLFSTFLHSALSCSCNVVTLIGLRLCCRESTDRPDDRNGLGAGSRNPCCCSHTASNSKAPTKTATRICSCCPGFHRIEVALKVVALRQ